MRGSRREDKQRVLDPRIPHPPPPHGAGTATPRIPCSPTPPLPRAHPDPQTWAGLLGPAEPQPCPELWAAEGSGTSGDLHSALRALEGKAFPQASSSESCSAGTSLHPRCGIFTLPNFC